MSATSELNVARKNLAEILGDSMKLYLQILKSWFRQKISREDFDHEARKLLSADSVHLHNQFLLAILTKCQAIGSALAQRDPNTVSQSSERSAPKPPKHSDNKKRSQCPRVTFHQRFLEASALNHVPHIQPYIPEPEDRRPTYISQEMLLPDIGLIHGRMIVTAWDYGIDDVEDDSVRLLLQAVEIQLKNVITAVFCRRNGYHLREKRFRHSFGTECPPTFLQNSALVNTDNDNSEATSISHKGYHIPALPPSLETALGDAAVQISTGSALPPTKHSVNLFDLYDALQVHKSVLPSHSVYSIAMERISNRLHHPSSEELEQEEIHKQEVQLKREIHAQQAVFRT